MKILLLEDNQERIESFRRLLKDSDLFVCLDVETAKNTCKNWNIDVFLLDHDLDQRIWVKSSEENTGYQFVKWMIENVNKENKLIYVHSLNIVGANRMVNLLHDNKWDGIWCPFTMLINLMEENNEKR